MNHGQIAASYIDKLGLTIVPLAPNDKRPFGKTWNNINTPDGALSFYDEHPDCGIGVNLGMSNVCSADLDWPEALDIIDQEFGFSFGSLHEKSCTIFGRAQRVMFRVPEGITLPYCKLTWKDANGNSKTVLELRAVNDGQARQDVLPPSIHPDTGEPYKWITRPSEAGVNTPPAWLMAIWQNWSFFKEQLANANPNNEKPKHQERLQAQPGGSVADQFDDAHDIHQMLERYGYKRCGRRYLSPHSNTGLPGVGIMDNGKAWIHHASDPLCSEETGRLVGPFDLFTQYEHGGDYRASTKAAARLLGIEFKKPERDSYVQSVDNHAPGGQEQQQKEEERKLGSYEYSTDTLRPIEFCIDGFLANKVTVIAGPPGVGKTSLLVPMACVSAGLTGSDSELSSTLRRRVAYITEDPEQVERILYGMRKHGVINCTEAEFRYWFDIIPAMRAPAAKVAQFVRNIREEKTVQAPAEQNGYMVEPLIVLDTSNATIDLDNENDNAEAGKAIAAIKENLGAACLWIVAHTSKVASRDDIQQMSARGAGAFEGDANAVAYIINVENIRFMVLGKRRFEANFSEVRFESQSSFEEVQAPWGATQKVWYRYGVPKIAADGERADLKEKAKEEASMEVRQEVKGKIISSLFAAGKNGHHLTQTELHKMVGGKKQIMLETIEVLLSTQAIYMRKGERNSTLYSSTPFQGTTGNN